MSGLYIHIPFCAKKCIYCDFYSVGVRNVDWERYINSLIHELSFRKKELTGIVHTIYIGGGTPSLMPINQLKRLINTIYDELSGMLKLEEFTIELNPDDVTEELVDALKEIGVTRVSMGVQSFNDCELDFIKRRHTSEQCRKAYNELSVIGNVSLDLIFGLPGQSLQSWEKNLNAILELHPQHISAYSLMYEEGTPLYAMLQQGRVREVEEELSLEMFKLLIDKLKKAGYNHYEISNFALDGYESKHNSSYWSGMQYLGLGPSAHSYDGNRTRRSNPASVNDYINHYINLPSIDVSFYEEEILSDMDLYNEYIITRMRRLDGIELHDLKHRFGEKLQNYFLKQTEKHIQSGVLLNCDNRIMLSEKGVLISDSIFVNLMY